MDKNLYKEFFDVESRHWWFLARRDIVLSLLHKYASPLEGKTVLDIGCGTGLVLRALEANGMQAEGLDMEPAAADYARASGVRSHITIGSFPQVDLGKTYDAILSLDVLEHIKDDAAALEKVRSLLKPDGTVVLTVPTHPFLWSAYDVYTHHVRRYRKREFIQLVEAAGFEIVFVSYFNMFFFLPILVVRKLKGLLRSRTASDVRLPPSWLNHMLYRVFAFEKALLNRWPLPFGVSLIAILKQKNV